MGPARPRLSGPRTEARLIRNILATTLLAVILVSGIVGSELGCISRTLSRPALQPDQEAWSSKRPSPTPRASALAESYKREARKAAEERACQRPEGTLGPAAALKSSSSGPVSVPASERGVEAEETSFSDPEESAAYGSAKRLLEILGSGRN